MSMTSSSCFGLVALSFAALASTLSFPAIADSERELAWGTVLKSRLITGVDVSSDEKRPVLVHVFGINEGKEPCLAKGNAIEMSDDGRVAIELESIFCADSRRPIGAYAREGQRTGVQGVWRKNKDAENISKALESVKINALRENSKRKEDERVPEEEMKRRFHALEAQVRSYIVYLEPGREFDLVLSKELRVGRAEGSTLRFLPSAGRTDL